MSSSGGMPYGGNGYPIATVPGSATVTMENPVDPAVNVRAQQFANLNQADIAFATAIDGAPYPQIAIGASSEVGITLYEGDSSAATSAASMVLSDGALIFQSTGPLIFQSNTGQIGFEAITIGELTIALSALSEVDITFADNTVGPVLVDTTNGHTYRIVSTAGVLSTVMVT